MDDAMGELPPCSDIDDPDEVPCLCPSGMMLDAFTHQCVPVGQPSVLPRKPQAKPMPSMVAGTKQFATMYVLGGVAIGATLLWMAKERGLIG